MSEDVLTYSFDEEETLPVHEEPPPEGWYKARVTSIRQRVGFELDEKYNPPEIAGLKQETVNFNREILDESLPELPSELVAQYRQQGKTVSW